MQSNTVAVENRTVNFASISVENGTSDPFKVVDGHYVGHDGFVVPKNFEEFYERFPKYVRDWVNRHVDRSVRREDREDWTQDLLMHLRFLPVISKHRDAGNEDAVQTFDPNKHYGASGARFFNYINICLRNKFRSIRSKQMKDVLCRAGNVSLAGHSDDSDSGQVDHEFCYAHSEYLKRRCQRQERQIEASYAFAEFTEFVKREDSSVLSLMFATATTATPAAASELLGISEPEFRHLSNSLRRLGQCFLTGEEPRRRRSTNPNPQHCRPCERAAIHTQQSCTTWNRVDLYNEVWSQPLVKLSRKYGISDVRLGKVCRRLKIPHPGRGFWAKRAVGQTVEQVPLPEFKDAPVVRRLNRKSQPKNQNRGKRARSEGREVIGRAEFLKSVQLGTTEREKEWLSGS